MCSFQTSSSTKEDGLLSRPHDRIDPELAISILPYSTHLYLHQPSDNAIECSCDRCSNRCPQVNDMIMSVA